MRTNAEHDTVPTDVHECSSAGSGDGSGRYDRLASTVPGGRVRFLRRLWKRHVTGDPDQYRAYVSLPTASAEVPFGALHDCIEELEMVFEGRLDVYARTRGVAVASDTVSAAQFDENAFEAAIDRIEDCYPETHTLARLEKCRPAGGRLVTTHVVVPVKPLFPRQSPKEKQSVRSTAE